ncbi:hypothetical protein FP744_10004620 [Trichoderma asperellum]
MVINTHKEPAITDFSSLDMCLDFIAVMPISANDEVDLIDDQVEPDTSVDDRLYQFQFFKPCLSREFLKAMPFCFNPKLAFLKPQHVVTTIHLEQCAFEHSQRGFSKQLTEYRIRFSGTLSYGLFNICDVTERKDWLLMMKMRGWNMPDCPEDVRRFMFVHMVATMGCNPVVTDKDMDCPKNWREVLHGRQRYPSEPVGHRSHGRTVCLHSIVVSPWLQGLGLGTAALKSYVQRIHSRGLADRVALLCRKHEIRFFAKCGFKNIGRSDTTSLPGQYYNMVFDLPDSETHINWKAIRENAEKS